MDYIATLLLALAAKYPLIASVLMVMGFLRLIFKPVMSAIEAIVKATATQADDAILAQVETSKIYLGFLWTLDWLASIKVPKPVAPVSPIVTDLPAGQANDLPKAS